MSVPAELRWDPAIGFLQQLSDAGPPAGQGWAPWYLHRARPESWVGQLSRRMVDDQLVEVDAERDRARITVVGREVLGAARMGRAADREVAR